MSFKLFSNKMISFFTLQCELFTSCNVLNNASLVSAWTEGGRGRGGGGRGVVNEMWTGLDRAGGGGGEFQKFPNLCGHPLWMTPRVGGGQSYHY